MFLKQQFFTTIITLLVSFPILCQPTLNINDQTPSIGETYEVHYAEVANFNLGGEGANQTWDYSNTNWNTLELEFAILAPGDGVSSVDFPDADFVWFLNAFEAYNYYQVMDSSIDLIGGASGEEDDILFKEIFSDTEDALRFPANYQDTYDYFSAFTSYFFGTQTSATRSGTVEFDGYGTLITPNGTYNNVLRMVITSSVSTFPEEQEIQYAWMLPGQFIPVMVYTIDGDPESMPTVYYAKKNVDTAVKTPRNIDLGFRLAANPAHDQLQVLNAEGISEDVQWYLFNNFGQRIVITNQANSFDLSNLAAGQYYLTAVTREGQQILPFIKQ